ncbi:hypothetical protein RIF29_40857 [Crotalaria pallida]|uniref:Myb-like domain-containing protein n=1 Tax=Crotalaria pallida TaxID=3830 RepID=A0AAN9HNU8_CROPI
MDMFAADHVSPFPDSGDLLYDPLFPPTDLLSYRHNPQKLRPIRPNTTTNNSPPLPLPLPLPVLNASSSSCEVNLLHPHHVEPSHPQQQYPPSPTHLVPGSGQPELCPLPTGLEPGWFHLFFVRLHYDSATYSRCHVSSSLDDHDDDENSSGSSKELGSRKRSKKTARNLEGFVQNLVMKVMEKQEQMHKQLVEMIEQKERERTMREEAWRREEMERIKKDEEARAQEKSRNLAIISFIQNLLGHEIQTPQPAEVSSKTEEVEGAAIIPNDFNGDPSNNRWPDAEVHALISSRISLEHKFRLMGAKGSIWEEISEAMHKKGYNRSARKCKEKWENINKYYRRTVGNGKKRPRQNSKTCLYFDELDILYRNGILINHGNALSNTNNVPKIEKESKTQ